MPYKYKVSNSKFSVERNKEKQPKYVFELVLG